MIIIMIAIIIIIMMMIIILIIKIINNVKKIAPTGYMCLRCTYFVSCALFYDTTRWPYLVCRLFVI